MHTKNFLRILFFTPCLLIQNCGKLNTVVVDDIQEFGQSIGDVTASIDEASGSNTGSGAFASRAGRIIARLDPGPTLIEQLAAWAEPSAHAAACSVGSIFSSCINNNMTHDFNSCTIQGTYTFTGSVSFAFSDATVDNTCVLSANGHNVIRTPSFSVTGRRGATLTVSAPGGGQIITRSAAANTYTLTAGGIRRVFTSGSTTLLDLTTSTTAAIGITGTNRLNRLVNGGTLRILDNKSGVFCDVSPANISWSSNVCNCPTSGNWQGTCSNGKTFLFTHSGCNSASLTVGDLSTTFNLDRCG